MIGGRGRRMSGRRVAVVPRRSESRSSERGQSLVETALTAMILLVLLAGMVDFGLAFGYRVAVANASRAGARFGSRFPGLPDQIRAAVVDALMDTLVLPDDYDDAPTTRDPRLGVTIACFNGAAPIGCNVAQRGQQIRVTVTYDYAPLFVRLLGLTSVPIGSVTNMFVLGPDRPTP